MSSMEKGPKVGQECDECGKRVAKICRVYKGHRYCATCYARVFKRRMCPGCGNFARLLKSEPSAVCIKCQTSKPCARCGKTDYAVGKITPYGPVCNSCSPHFREPEPCELCGSKSTRLTRVSRFGHEHRVCPKCARADYDTCQACRCHRQLHVSADGRKLCKTCLEKGDVPCQKCGEPMPAGYGKQCQACYWKGLLEKRIRMDCAAFSMPQMDAHFEAFGQWLGKEVGEHKAAITLHRYLLFFLDIEKQWRAIPDYGELLAYFGALRLRRVLLPMRWMQEIGLVLPDAVAREEDSERRRIFTTLDKVGTGTRERTILDGYHKALMEDLKEDKMILRSIRLTLTPAATLLLRAREIGCMPPDQKALDSYLEKTPGQRAAVSGFVRYLREKYGVEIALPKIDSGKAERNRRKKLEAEMLVLMRECGSGEEFSRRWLSVALAYFHGLPRKTGKNIPDEQITAHGDGSLTIVWNSQKYWLPEACTYRLEWHALGTASY